ncbi:hypothetical protein D3C84_607050 [compost metagenome]
MTLWLFAELARIRHTTRRLDRANARFYFQPKQKPYDPFTVPSSRVWRLASTVVPLGSLGNHQPVVVHLEPGPQPSGVLRLAIALAERPGGARQRMHQGGTAAPGAASRGGQPGGARGLFLPDPGAGLARPPGQARCTTDLVAAGQHPQRPCWTGRPNHSRERVLGAIAGERVEPLEAAVRRQLGGHRAPAPPGQHSDPGPQDPRAIRRPHPPGRVGAAEFRS